MDSLSTRTTSFLESESLQEQRRKEKLEAEQAKKQSQNTASDTQSAVSAAQKSKEQTAQARTRLPGTNGTIQSSDTASDTTQVTDSQTSSKKGSKDLKGNSLDLFNKGSFNNDKAVGSVIDSRPRFTQKQEKQTTELLLKQTEALQQRTKKLSGMLARDGNQSHEEAAEYHSTWYGADYSTNLFDKHNGNRLTELAETERLQSGKMQRASNTLEDTRQEAEKLIQQGEYTKARETLEKGLLFANQEFFDTQKIIARERTDPAKLGEVLQNIDTSYKAARNGIIMAGAAIVTGGVAANFMAGGGLLSAGAAGASQTSLSGLAATKAFAMGTGSATAAAFGGDVVGSLAQGMTVNEALQHSSEQILENAKNAALGSLGAITGIGVGGRLASSLLSPQASASLQHLVRSSTAGATGSIPGVVNDIASKVGERQGLISELTQAGKSQEEIDKALAERKLDFNSISLSSAASLVSGAASGYIGSLATRANSSALVQGLTRTEATAAQAAIAVAEEMTQVGIAAAESSAQGYTPGTPEFEQAVLANFASLVPSRIAGTVSTETSARQTEQAGTETTKESTLDESGNTEFFKINSDGNLQTAEFTDNSEGARAVFEKSKGQQLARTEQIKQARELAITRNSELTRDVVNRLLRNYSSASIKIKTKEDAEIISQGSSPKSKEQRERVITLRDEDGNEVNLEISENDLQKSNPYLKLVSNNHSGLQDLNPNFPAGYKLTERDRLLLQRAIEKQPSVGENKPSVLGFNPKFYGQKTEALLTQAAKDPSFLMEGVTELIDRSRIERRITDDKTFKKELLELAGIKNNGFGYVIDDLTKFSSLLDRLKEKPDLNQTSQKIVGDLISETLDTLIIRSLNIDTETDKKEATGQLSRLCDILQQARTLGIESIKYHPIDSDGEIDEFAINAEIPELIEIINNESNRISNILIRRQQSTTDALLRFLSRDDDDDE